MPDPSVYPLAELAVMERSGFPESRHFGSLVGLSADGTVVLSLGDPSAPMLPRSAVKPFQAAACREAGLDLSVTETAISAGSHTGEDRHIEAVRRILVEAGLDDSALQCPADWPEDEATRNRLIVSGEGPAAVRMNCSGLHAAMLATCVYNGWDIGSYLEPAHPLQSGVRAAIERATGGPATHVAVDGCGTPTFATTVLGLARAAQGLVTGAGGRAGRDVADAMRAEPFYVGGTGHANTELMRRIPGAVCKGGAEGVIMAVAATGEAVAMKIIDGSSRPATVLALVALSALGVDTSGACDLAEVLVLGRAQPVGRLRLGADIAGAVEALQR